MSRAGWLPILAIQGCLGPAAPPPGPPRAAETPPAPPRSSSSESLTPDGSGSAPTEQPRWPARPFVGDHPERWVGRRRSGDERMHDDDFGSFGGVMLPGGRLSATYFRDRGFVWLTACDQRKDGACAFIEVLQVVPLPAGVAGTLDLAFCARPAGPAPRGLHIVIRDERERITHAWSLDEARRRFAPSSTDLDCSPR